MLSICVSLKAIEKLFPFIIILEANGKIAFLGNSMKKLAPHLAEEDPFFRYFKILKPAYDGTDFDFENHLAETTIIELDQPGAKFMGQWIRPGKKPFYAFIGSLSITDPLELKKLGLTFDDFPVQDQIFDFLLLAQTQKRSIAEAELANQKLAEAHKIAVQASETKSQFLANMSHELRTPMNGVLGMASVLKDGTQLTDEQDEFVDNIIQSGESMLALINDILDLTKVESGHIQMSYEKFQIQDLIEEIHGVIQVSAQKKHNKIEVRIDDDVPEIIYTDRLRLRQILINLLGNANKFTTNGRISIQVKSVPDRSGLIQFVVEDTGMGMSEEVQRKIFSPFVQGDSSMTKKFGGTGLGLSISKKLVEALGGGIRCTSQEGRGSRFEFEVEKNNRSDNNAEEK